LLFHEVLIVFNVISGAPPCGQHPAPEAPQLYTLHFTTVNTVEATINEMFLDALDKMIRPGTYMRPQVVAWIFIDFMMEARLLERIGEPTIPPEVADLDFTLRQLLTATPLQYWPYPALGARPCAFCEADGDPQQLEAHLHENHQEILAGGKFYSAV
jgi:hypothetical protein